MEYIVQLEVKVRAETEADAITNAGVAAQVVWNPKDFRILGTIPQSYKILADVPHSGGGDLTTRATLSPCPGCTPHCALYPQCRG